MLSTGFNIMGTRDFNMYLVINKFMTSLIQENLPLSP